MNTAVQSIQVEVADEAVQETAKLATPVSIPLPTQSIRQDTQARHYGSGLAAMSSSNPTTIGNVP